MPEDHEIVHTVTDYYDGPRGGVVDFRGRPHAYKSLWDDTKEEWSDTLLLRPIDDETLRFAIEDWDIWERWRHSFDAGQTTIETHPALPADRQRHEQLAAILEPRLRIEPDRAIRVRGRFSVHGGQWTVQWFSHENKG